MDQNYGLVPATDGLADEMAKCRPEEAGEKINNVNMTQFVGRK